MVSPETNYSTALRRRALWVETSTVMKDDVQSCGACTGHLQVHPWAESNPFIPGLAASLPPDPSCTSLGSYLLSEQSTAEQRATWMIDGPAKGP